MNLKKTDMMRRGRCLAQGQYGEGPVVYWMSRDQRAGDNWALLWAQQEALIHQKGLLVVFCMIPNYPGATLRHYNFMRNGLDELQEKLNQYNIGFRMLKQSPDALLPSFLRTIDAHLLVSDFDPLRIKQQWKKKLITSLKVPFYEVDAHNIIPAWIVSDKKEFAAYTLRPKIKRVLDDYLTDIPAVRHHPFTWNIASAWVSVADRGESFTNQTTDDYPWIKAGEAAATLAALNFVRQRLENYPDARNNPLLDGQSGLSPYLHFGQLSPQRLAWMVSRSALPAETKDAFLEELVVRRELADNFCYNESAYDRFAGFPEWARKTLDQHRNDKRAYVYSLAEFENGTTHEILWNACQRDLIQSGKLHGFLRMYWAKKILEWTPDPETALEYAITLNDRYSLDGRDPNGYTGIAWSLGGVHDRAWRERPVFGKIRYMNEAGCRRKFDVQRYIATIFNKD